MIASGLKKSQSQRSAEARPCGPPPLNTIGPTLARSTLAVNELLASPEIYPPSYICGRELSCAASRKTIREKPRSMPTWINNLVISRTVGVPAPVKNREAACTVNPEQMSQGAGNLIKIWIKELFCCNSFKPRVRGMSLYPCSVVNTDENVLRAQEVTP
jgi:hypothetical protein